MIKEKTSALNTRRRTEDKENITSRKRRRTTDENFAIKGIHLEVRRRYNTRSRLKKHKESLNEQDSNDDEESSNDGPKLKVLFPWAKPFERTIDLMKTDVFIDEEEEDPFDEYPLKRRKVLQHVNKSVYDPNNIPSPDEITQEMLDNIAEKSSGKTYNKAEGTSCHQCRQKTIDTKTVCRSGECIGVRGQFCGPCLRGRYGESALEALKDPDWACPPCRGLCNCSICRTRNGQRPTGILAPIVQEEGYSSVMDYLQVVDN
ncbi:cell division cycle-associated protein 7 isoform X2 [Cephus cinctus]|nr:cell division cycle-associated protein 7 isoform X2 [Cephus cinctus]